MADILAIIAELIEHPIAALPNGPVWTERKYYRTVTLYHMYPDYLR